MTFADEMCLINPSLERLMWSLKCDEIIASEEGFKELWEATKNRVLEMFGHQETMAKNLREMLSKNVFENLEQDYLVKAVVPRDLALATAALQATNEVLVKLRAGDLLKLEEYIGKDFEDVGIEYREDGIVHMDKFKMGDWGMGKGKSNVSSPLEFKKTVEEVKWDVNGKQIAQALLKEIDVVNKSKMISSINLHYQTLIKSVYSKQEKSGVSTDKKIMVKHIKNMISVRNTLIKFIYKQIKQVIKAYSPPDEKSEGTQSTYIEDEGE